jgi:branched-chain amino acid transport system permease protein
MIYREAGQFKTTYPADQQVFPIRQDRIAVAVLLVVAFVVVPLVANQYWLSAILTPFLILALATLGLNILTGYAGQLSLGTAAFMAVGAFMAYNFELRMPWLPTLVSFALAGLCAAAVGIVFGLPSLRIKGFYLAVATLACQFFVLWALQRIGWFTNHSTSGVITAQKVAILGYTFDSPAENYMLTLCVVAVLAVLAKNMLRSETGRKFMAVRDMDLAAEVIGIRMMQTKLLAFAISSFYCGVAGALYAYTYLGTVEPEAFNLDLSFRILFMVIIGGVGSILGSFMGAAFIVLLPIFLNTMAGPIEHLLGVALPAGLMSNLELIVFGALIIFFLIVEPHGLARLWQIGKEKLRLWPFPH